MIQQSVL